MKLVKPSGITPMRNVQAPWDRVTSCKHYFPCDGLTDGRLVDVKGGVIASPQSGYEYVYDANRYAVRSTADFSVGREPLYSGDFATLTAGKYCLIVYAGYVLNETHAPTNERFLRVGFGDLSVAGQGGFGVSDGEDGSTIEAHAIIKVSSTQYAASYDGSVNAYSLADTIYNALGTTGHFWRYALFNPNTIEVESACYRSDTGALLLANDTQYGLANPIPDVPFDAKFRMSGLAATGIARFDFDTLPSDYLLGMHTMAREWSLGNRFVWPYWY